MTVAMNEAGNLWQRVLTTHRQYANAVNEFLVTPADKIAVLQQALRSKDRSLALQMVHSLSVEEKKALLPAWVNLGRAAHSPFQIAWTVIESLPRDWVVANIEKEVDAILQNEEETDYWMFLQLYVRLDHGLMKKLAQRAATHLDPDIKELGDEYLAKP